MGNYQSKFTGQEVDENLQSVCDNKASLRIMDVLNKTGIFYYREGAIDNPVEGDRRDTGNGIGRNGDEVYIGGKWLKKIDVGSVGTDMITLRDGLNDVKVKVGNKYFNLVRNLKT